MSQHTAMGAAPPGDDDLGPLMTPGEVAKLFHVNPKTVTRWARAGKISSVRTLGGHRRFLAREIEEILNRDGPPAEPNSSATSGLPTP